MLQNFTGAGYNNSNTVSLLTNKGTGIEKKKRLAILKLRKLQEFLSISLKPNLQSRSCVFTFMLDCWSCSNNSYFRLCFASSIINSEIQNNYYSLFTAFYRFRNVKIREWTWWQWALMLFNGPHGQVVEAQTTMAAEGVRSERYQQTNRQFLYIDIYIVSV